MTEIKNQYINTLEMSREEWLAHRRKGIGGSDAASVLGINPYKTRLQLYLDKVNGVEIQDNAKMRAGRMIEDAISDMWCEDTGGQVRKDNKIRYHESRPYLYANLDRVIVNDFRGPGILECKNTSSWRLERHKAEGYDCIPEHQAQVMHYLGVTGYSWGEIAYLIDGWNLHRVPIARNDQWLEEVYYPAVDDFWLNHIEPQIMPEPSGEEEVKRIFDRVDSGKCKEAETDEIEEMVMRLKGLNQVIKESEEDASMIRTELMKYIGDSETLTYQGRTLVTWKQTKGSERFDAAAFEKENPELYKRYSRLVPGYRRFLIK